MCQERNRGPCRIRKIPDNGISNTFRVPMRFAGVFMPLALFRLALAAALVLPSGPSARSVIRFALPPVPFMARYGGAFTAICRLSGNRLAESSCRRFRIRKWIRWSLEMRKASARRRVGMGMKIAFVRTNRERMTGTPTNTTTPIRWWTACIRKEALRIMSRLRLRCANQWRMPSRCWCSRTSTVISSGTF